MKDDCVFCKIIKGEIPSFKVYEDEHTLAFLDVAKDIDGHTLVIPKKHYQNIMEIPQETYLHVMKTMKKLSEHYVENCGYQAINILNASGKEAGQSVFHLHFHLYPRKKDDKADLWPKNKLASIPLNEMREKIKVE